MRARLIALLLAAAALAPAAAARAQTTPRDTIRIGGDTPADTVELPADSAERRRTDPRWATPFAVETSGEVSPNRPTRDVVWLAPDSVRARRMAAAAARDSANAAADEDDSTVASADSTPPDSTEAPPPPRTRRASADSTGARRTGARTASRDTTAAARRATGRTASRDTTTTSRRDSGRTARADTAAASTRRTAARGDTAASRTRRPAARDSATTRRTASRDSTSTRRSAARDSTARRTAARDTTARRTASRDTAGRARTTGPRPRTHTVTGGETLYGIARRYGVTTAQIRALNPDVGETLEVGTVLRLPAGAHAPGQPAPRETPSSGDDEKPAPTRRTPAARADTAARRPPAARAGRRTHTVAAGETLFGLARRYGVSVDAIRTLNHLESDRLRPGQTLVIPAAPKP